MSEQNGSTRQAYLLFVWSPSGYTVREVDGDPPAIGAEVEEGLVISKIGASPFPGDARPCAYSMGKGKS
jgi:hypothetical protein